VVFFVSEKEYKEDLDRFIQKFGRNEIWMKKVSIFCINPKPLEEQEGFFYPFK
jgi:hypothetical protein